MIETYDKATLRKLREVVGDAAREKIDAALNAPLSAPPEEPADRMNKTEAAYAREWLDPQMPERIRWWEFEGVKLRLADKTWYTPDFFVIRHDGSIEIHEVKGFWRDDARVKAKVAARLYPHFRFLAVTRRKKKDGGGWKFESFKGA